MVGSHSIDAPTDIFHPHCVDVWLLGNKSCPMCKQAVDETPSPNGFLGARGGGADNERSNPNFGAEALATVGDIESPPMATSESAAAAAAEGSAGTQSGSVVLSSPDVPRVGRVAATIRRTRQTRREVMRRMNQLRRRNGGETAVTATRGEHVSTTVAEEGIEMVVPHPNLTRTDTTDTPVTI
jgi:hypothetical protein